jgi:hypothetical protein
MHAHCFEATLSLRVLAESCNPRYARGIRLACAVCVRCVVTPLARGSIWWRMMMQSARGLSSWKCRRRVRCSALNDTGDRKTAPEECCGKSGLRTGTCLDWLGSLHQEHRSAVVVHAQVGPMMHFLT